MPRKAMSDRQKQANRSKQKIAKAALSLFQKKGYHNVTIEDICKKADVSVGGFYHHFSSKGAVFEIVMSEITGKVSSYVRAHPSGGSAREDLRQFLLFLHNAIRKSTLAYCRPGSIPASAPSATLPTIPLFWRLHA